MSEVVRETLEGFVDKMHRDAKVYRQHIEAEQSRPMTTYDEATFVRGVTEDEKLLGLENERRATMRRLGMLSCMSWTAFLNRKQEEIGASRWRAVWRAVMQEELSQFDIIRFVHESCQYQVVGRNKVQLLQDGTLVGPPNILAAKGCSVERREAEYVAPRANQKAA